MPSMRTSPRRRAREFALQGFYQWLLSGNDPALIRTQLAEVSGFAKCDTRFFDGLWRGITGEFDTLVAAFAPFLDRAASGLSPVDESILTIGAWELLREPAGPYRLAIKEARELAKAYGGADAQTYVNGVP